MPHPSSQCASRGISDVSVCISAIWAVFGQIIVNSWAYRIYLKRILLRSVDTRARAYCLNCLKPLQRSL
jgi:hypothetical protein